jgi:HSP20 family protein
MLYRPFEGFYAPRRRSTWPTSSGWREMDRLRREMDRLFADWPTHSGWTAAPAYPAMNVWTNEEGVVVTAELPGVAPEDMDISVVNETLTVTGTRQPELVRQAEEVEGATYHRRERSQGRFTRSFQLPFRIEGDKVEAAFERGVLHIHLPRAEADKPKKISVKAG